MPIIIVADVGPFLTKGEAQTLVDLATRAGVEDIPAAMVDQARLAYIAGLPE